uniref:Uncharacterized protein n=1 Tax=Populus trichocarpa TaxID=3694 RepID=A9PFL2_POPTR|nr:unknown [Populus trichocarpa]
MTLHLVKIKESKCCFPLEVVQAATPFHRPTMQGKLQTISGITSLVVSPAHVR